MSIRFYRLYLFILFFSQISFANTEKIALIIGCNNGLSSDPALQYAESDAQAVAKTLTELGNFRQGRMYLLLGKSSKDIIEALREISGRIKELSLEGKQTQLLIYYSGHGSSNSFHVRGEKLKFEQFRPIFDQIPSDLKILISDACFSGALVTEKGGKFASPVEIKMTQSPDVKGSIIITSASGTEFAHESKILKGSLFTHHFIAALRGAADYDKDRSITLWEAYNYARLNTIRHGSYHNNKSQHPEFDIKISGQQNVVFSNLQSAQVTFNIYNCKPGKYIITDNTQLNTQLELNIENQFDSINLAFPAGRYLLSRKANNSMRICQIDASWGGKFNITENHFKNYPVDILSKKGTTLQFTPHNIIPRIGFFQPIPNKQKMIPHPEISYALHYGSYNGELTFSYVRWNEAIKMHSIPIQISRSSYIFSGEIQKLLLDSLKRIFG